MSFKRKKKAYKVIQKLQQSLPRLTICQFIIYNIIHVYYLNNSHNSLKNSCN